MMLTSFTIGEDQVDVFTGRTSGFDGMQRGHHRDLNRFWITFGQESVFVADAPPAEIAPEILQSYVGSYKGKRGLAAEITLDDGQLYVMPTGQPTMRLWPVEPGDVSAHPDPRRDDYLQRRKR